MKLIRRTTLKSSALILILVLFVGRNSYSQPDSVYTVCFQDSTRFGTSGGSNCWGWTSPAGVDYAIIGVFNGIRFVNTETMQSEGFVPGPTGGICGGIVWREIKAYSNYCYAVSECTGTNDGLQVINMSTLPDSVHLEGTFAVNGSTARTSHTISVDSVAGFLYCEGNSTPATSIYIHNISNPATPTFVGSFGISSGIHDMYAHDDTVYVAEGSSGRWAIWSLANKASPSLLARPAIPSSGYVHNIWPTADRQYAASTEETANKTVKIWDISNLSSISLEGEYLAPSNLAHNAHFKGDTLYLAHYESGVAVVDISDPTDPKEMARYDTYVSSENSNFNGAWGCHPFTASGLIYASNIDGSLWILKEEKVALADTLYPGLPVNMGNDMVKVDIYGTNSFPLKKIIIPFSYAGPATTFFHSCSTNGTRTQGFTTSHALGVDFNNNRAAWEVITTGAPMAPGSGVILSIWFTVETGYAGPYNPISFIDNWLNLEPTFQSACATYRPKDFDYVEICCTGARGDLNVDGTNANILDLTFMVDRVFRAGPSSVCPNEADVNADSTSEDILDLTYLVDRIFRGGPLPPPCN